MPATSRITLTKYRCLRLTAEKPCLQREQAAALLAAIFHGSLPLAISGYAA